MRTDDDDDTRNGEQEYLAARAEAEIEAASRSANSAAVRAHYRMAEAYLDRLYPPVDDAGEPGEAADGDPPASARASST